MIAFAANHAAMLNAIECSAVVASAIYGILLAARKQFDVVGVLAIAFAVAFGGGTLRDLFLDRPKLFWIEHDHYAVIVFALAVVGSILPRQLLKIEKLLPLPDALGLGLFSIVGASYAIDQGHSMFIASLLGVITGTFGGVIGEVICNEIPSLFRPAPLHATCSFAGAWVYLLINLTDAPGIVAVSAGIVVVVVMRLAALRWNVRFPAMSLGPHDESIK